MPVLAIRQLLSLLIFAAITPLLSAQFVSPYPVSDCSGGIAFGQASCPSQAGCCAGGAACCAGGCCPILAYCVNVGLPNEGCCPLSDSDSCGASVASFSKPACSETGSFNPKPSVQCVSADDDWYCPPDSICGARYPSCINFGSAGCESGTPESVSSPEPTAGPSGTTGSDGQTTTGSETGSASQSPSTTRASPLGAGQLVERPGIGMLGALAAALGLVF